MPRLVNFRLTILLTQDVYGAAMRNLALMLFEYFITIVDEASIFWGARRITGAFVLFEANRIAMLILALSRIWNGDQANNPGR